MSIYNEKKLFFDAFDAVKLKHVLHNSRGKLRTFGTLHKIDDAKWFNIKKKRKKKNKTQKMRR